MSMSDNPEAQERAAFEADAEPMGFDLTRQRLAVPEPWVEYQDADTGHRWAGWLARAERAALAQQAATPAPAEPVRVYLVATGLTHEGRELYERYDVRPPLCEAETLYAAPPATPAPAEPPAIDYDALIRYCYKTLGHAQGTKGCIAFARGAEWMRDQIAAPPATPAAIQDECVATGRSCSFTWHGPNGERQCEHCGDTPATPAAQPADGTGRTPTDYALEHAEYLAVNAERLLEALNAEGELRVRREESDDVDDDDMQDAHDSCIEAMRSVRNGIHGFRTRRDRAAAMQGKA